MEKRVFVKNAAILTVTSLLLRTIGIFFRIYISNKIGAEGMGLYQLIISVYVLASTFAVAGLTTAVTRLVADELVSGTKRSVTRILRTAILLSTMIGGLSAALIYVGADSISLWFLKDARAASALRILSFSLPFMGISSCLKGYFSARRKIASSSRAQILEQLVRIAVIFLIIDRFSERGIESACFAVLLGDTVAEAASCLYMIISYYWDRHRLHIHQKTTLLHRHGLLYRMLSIAAPITGGRYINSGLRTIENVMVPDVLTGYTASKEVALAQFGKLKGMALPLLFFPSSFLMAFSSLLIPEISEANALQYHRQVAHTVDKTLHITLLSSVLISGLFTVFAIPLGECIYHDTEVGLMLRILSPLAPFMYLESVADGILKGLGQQTHSFLFGVIDSVLRIGLIVVALPRFGMNGFLGVMVISNLLTCGLNIHRLLKVSHTHIRWMKWVLKPLLAMSTAGVIAKAAQAVPIIASLPLIVRLATGAVLAFAVYCLLIFMLGCVQKGDFIRHYPIQKAKKAML